AREMSTKALRTEFIHEGLLILNPDHEFKLIGKYDTIRLEVGMLEKEVDYDHFDELIEIRKARFQTAQVKTINMQNIDFNRISPNRMEQLLDGCEMEIIKFELSREHYNQDVFSFIQRMQNRNKLQNRISSDHACNIELHLSMCDFILTKEELLSLKSGGNLKATGNNITPINDELFLELLTNEHSLSIDTNLTAPETIRDAFKIISNNETEQIVVMHISDDLFNRFLHLIGARMIDDELVMENDIEGFFVANDNIMYCIGDYTIFYELTHGMIFREHGEKKEWIFNLAKMIRRSSSEDKEESEDEDEEECGEESEEESETEESDSDDSEENYEHHFKMIGKEDSILLQIDEMENEIDYDKFAELMNKKKSDFKNDVFKTVNILNVDFNRVAPHSVEQVLEGCEFESITFEITREHYNQDVFAFIQRMENRATLHLTMCDFILSKEELLALKPGGRMKSIGTISTPIDDALLLDLVAKSHSFTLDTNISSPETIRDVYKFITQNEKPQIILLLFSDDLFNRFVNLIGARMIDDELVMENDTEGFVVFNQDHGLLQRGGDFYMAEYLIAYEFTSGRINRRNEDGNEWYLTLAKMKKNISEAFPEESEEESDSDESDD
ncbi:hypothetical protein PRIPAC_78818, partial [Pristionchus pacificus]